ncbi:MAG: hypothetical protein WBL25_13250, partial [Anaerolineales bacterium]
NTCSPFDQTALNTITEDLMCLYQPPYYERTVRPEAPAVLEAIKQMGFKIDLISNVNTWGQVPTNFKGTRRLGFSGIELNYQINSAMLAGIDLSQYHFSFAGRCDSNF